MNKEEIEQAKGHLGWLLDNGILTSEDEPHIENILKYIQQLELNVEASRMEHENDLKMIDEVKGNAVKWSKERDNLKVILDKVTDKLKEVDKKYKNEYENIENMELSATKICVLQELTCVIEDIEEILNIIEGEKK